MSGGGWLIMGVSVGTVSLLFFWCMCKVLSSPEETEHLKGFDSDTPDR